eukprot:3790658-Pyramimonas_sp.AAC.1
MRAAERAAYSEYSLPRAGYKGLLASDPACLRPQPKPPETRALFDACFDACAAPSLGRRRVYGSRVAFPLKATDPLTRSPHLCDQKVTNK